LVVTGQVDGQEAFVSFDVAAALTLVTAGCFDAPRVSPGRWKRVSPLGLRDEVLPLTRLSTLTVEGLRLPPQEAALRKGERCEVTLGADVLDGLALHFDVRRRQLKLTPSQPRAVYRAMQFDGGTSEVVEVTRDPTYDWPLVPVRLAQGKAALTAAFVLATDSPATVVLDSAASQAGLTRGLELLAGLPLPEGVVVSKELDAVKSVPFVRFDLAPGQGVSQGSVGLVQGTTVRAASGAVGLDVLGTFDFTLDVTAGALVLRRPLQLVDGRPRCGPDGEASCFQLEQAGHWLTATVWRPLPTGAKVYLEGGSASSRCRFGFSFGPGGEGRSTQHRLPWASLREASPACAQALERAGPFAFSLVEEEPLTGCPGICAFVADFSSGRQSCECQPARGALSADEERRLLGLYRQLMERAPPRPAGAQEPDDP
jgi:hypothetical protein